MKDNKAIMTQVKLVEVRLIPCGKKHTQTPAVEMKNGENKNTQYKESYIVQCSFL